MITIYSPAWHDDGIVECYAILLTLHNEQTSLRAARGKLIDVREALSDFYGTFSVYAENEEDTEKFLCIFDALACVTEAMQARNGCRNAIRMACRCLERLKLSNHVHQV